MNRGALTIELYNFGILLIRIRSCGLKGFAFNARLWGNNVAEMGCLPPGHPPTDGARMAEKMEFALR